MKKLILTTALILGAAAPALAQSQLERQLGVEAGVYTNAQLAAMHAAQSETGNEGRVYTDGEISMVLSTRSVANDRSVAIFDRLFAEDRSENSGLATKRIYTSYGAGETGVNSTASAIFAQLRAEDRSENNGF